VYGSISANQPNGLGTARTKWNSGKHPQLQVDLPPAPPSDFLAALHTLIDAPPDAGVEYNKIKKDLLHAFIWSQSLLIMVYILSFLECFGITLCTGTPLLMLLLTTSVALSFSSVLIKCSFTICTLLLLALHVMSWTHLATVLMLKPANHFFLKLAWAKMGAVADLSHQGYLSEGGPHSDIYKKFEALHGTFYFFYHCIPQIFKIVGPRLIVNCLTDPLHMVQSSGMVSQIVLLNMLLSIW